MGMDVYGKNPSSEAGKYFRANVWSWGPIHDLIRELCSDLFDERTIVGMAWNQGDGPESQDVCAKMANRFTEWMAHNTGGHSVDENVDMSNRPEASIIEACTELGLDTTPSEPVYYADDEHLAEWVEFLRNCGGFEVW